LIALAIALGAFAWLATALITGKTTVIARSRPFLVDRRSEGEERLAYWLWVAVLGVFAMGAVGYLLISN